MYLKQQVQSIYVIQYGTFKFKSVFNKQFMFSDVYSSCFQITCTFAFSAVLTHKYINPEISIKMRVLVQESTSTCIQLKAGSEDIFRSRTQRELTQNYSEFFSLLLYLHFNNQLSIFADHSHFSIVH